MRGENETNQQDFHVSPLFTCKDGKSPCPGAARAAAYDRFFNDFYAMIHADALYEVLWGMYFGYVNQKELSAEDANTTALVFKYLLELVELSRQIHEVDVFMKKAHG